MNKKCICYNPCNEFCADSRLVPTTEKLKSIIVNNPIKIS